MTAVRYGRLAGKTAIVTGAGGGIGRSIVRRFAEEGALVLAADIDEAAMQAAAAPYGKMIRSVRHDAGDEASWAALVGAALDWTGELNVLVNNAAFRIPLTIETATLELWEQNHRVTSAGVFLGTKFGAEAMVKGGAIVNVASVGAFVGLPASLPYSAAKGAVRAMSRSAAMHFAGRKPPIRVNVVAPGAVLTEAVRRQYEAIADREGVTPADIMTRYLGTVPMNRMADPDEVANAILFLASDEASFITGAELLVDGGATAA